MASSKKQKKTKTNPKQTPTTPIAASKSAKPAKVEAKRERSSALDAAAKVLAGNGEPMNCNEMVKAMLAKGLWTTNGRTPASTLYSGILREITKKGKQSRFRKIERGKFSLVS